MSPSIIPHPVSVEERDGTYALHSGQSITARGAASAALPAVQGLLADAGIALETADDGGALVLEENAALPDEGTNCPSVKTDCAWLRLRPPDFSTVRRRSASCCPSTAPARLSFPARR